MLTLLLLKVCVFFFWFLFFDVVLSVLTCFVNISLRKRELVVLLKLCSHFRVAVYVL